MTKAELDKLNLLNSCIVKENGSPVTIGDKLLVSNLDSLGYMLLFIELKEQDALSDKINILDINICTITVKELIEGMLNVKGTE